MPKILAEPYGKMIPHEPLSELWEIVGADIFSTNNNTPFCIVVYYSKIPVMKRADGISAYDLIRAVKIVFAEFWTTKQN